MRVPPDPVTRAALATGWHCSRVLLASPFVVTALGPGAPGQETVYFMSNYVDKFTDGVLPGKSFLGPVKDGGHIM